MEKQQTRLTVYLPPEIEQAIYADFLKLAKAAIDQTSKNVTINNRYLNQKELAEYFKCSTKVIKEWQIKGLRSFQKGKEIMFDMKDVEVFLDTIKY